MNDHVSIAKDAALSTPPVAVVALTKIGVILSPILTILTVVYTLVLLYKHWRDWLGPLVKKKFASMRKKS